MLIPFRSLSGDEESLDASAGTRFQLGTSLDPRGRLQPAGPSLYRFGSGRWVVESPEGRHREVTPESVIAWVLLTGDVIYWEWPTYGATAPAAFLLETFAESRSRFFEL